MSFPTHSSPEQLTRQWFEQAVLGLNLCPFAHRPARQKQIHFYVSQSTNETRLLDELIKETQRLATTPISQLETILFIVPALLQDFYDYQFFLEEAQRHFKRHQWQGIFQLASFHPNYCFFGSEPNDPANLTNRSPYPLIHILRESSLTEALKNVESPEEIPQRNIVTMEELSEADKRALFPYLG